MPRFNRVTSVYAQQIEFNGSRRVTLVGNLTHADSPRGVLLVRGPQPNPHGDGLFGPLAVALRSAGWSSLCFDVCGSCNHGNHGKHGNSGNNGNKPMTPQAAANELGRAVALMRSLGYRHLALWVQGRGARWFMDAALDVDWLVLSDRVPQPASHGWRPRQPHTVQRAVGQALLPCMDRFDVDGVTPQLHCPALALALGSAVALPVDGPVPPTSPRSAAIGRLQHIRAACAEQMVLEGVRWLALQSKAAAL